MRLYVPEKKHRGGVACRSDFPPGAQGVHGVRQQMTLAAKVGQPLRRAKGRLGPEQG
jgi:hypothetical protein